MTRLIENDDLLQELGVLNSFLEHMHMKSL